MLKGGRYLLLGARELVHQQPRQRSRLGALLAANQTLHKVYILREDLRQLWSQKDRKAATLFLFSWLVEAFSLAAEQNLPPLHRLASKLLSTWPRLVSW